MSISEPFIRRPVATSLLMVGVILLGLLGYYLLPISALPTVDFPTIQVTHNLSRRQPGCDGLVRHDAAGTAVRPDQRPGVDDFHQLVRHIDHHSAIQSRSTDIDAAAQDVQAAINAADGVLPQDLPEPADLQQSQSGGHADPDACDHFRHACRWKK